MSSIIHYFELCKDRAQWISKQRTLGKCRHMLCKKVRIKIREIDPILNWNLEKTFEAAALAFNNLLTVLSPLLLVTTFL